MFINQPEDQQNLEDREENFPVTGVLEAISGTDLQQGVDRTDRQEKSGWSAMVEYNSVRKMCPELDYLDMTMRQLEMGNRDMLQSMVMQQLRQPDFELHQLANWATSLIKGIGCNKGKEREALEGLDPEFLEFIGLGQNTFSKWKNNTEDTRVMGLSRKRGAAQYIDLHPTKVFLAKDSPVHLKEAEVVTDLQLETQENFSTQLNLSDAEDNDHPNIIEVEEPRDTTRRTRSRSRKKEARR